MQAKPLAIGETLAYQTGSYVIRLQRVTADCWNVTTERGGFRIDALARTFATEDKARGLAHDIATMLRDGATVEQVVAAIQPAADVIAAAEQLLRQAAIPGPRLAPAAKGTTQRVSDPQHLVLAYADAAPDGMVARGRIEDGRAPITTINAMARRGWLDRIDRMDGRRRITVGGRITAKGRRRLAELDAANRNPIAA